MLCVRAPCGSVRGIYARGAVVNVSDWAPGGAAERGRSGPAGGGGCAAGGCGCQESEAGAV